MNSELHIVSRSKRETFFKKNYPSESKIFLLSLLFAIFSISVSAQTPENPAVAFYKNMTGALSTILESTSNSGNSNDCSDMVPMVIVYPMGCDSSVAKVETERYGAGGPDGNKYKLVYVGQTFSRPCRSIEFLFAGTYQVFMTKSDGSCTSPTTTFTVSPPTNTIIYDVETEPYYIGTGQSASAPTLNVVAQGTINNYQWFENTTKSYEGGVAIGGATSSSYTPDVYELGQTYYYVKVSGCEDILSQIATVKIVDHNPVSGMIMLDDYIEGCPNENSAVIEVFTNSSPQEYITCKLYSAQSVAGPYIEIGGQTFTNNFGHFPFEVLNLPVTTYFRVMVYSSYLGTDYISFTSAVKINVQGPPEIINEFTDTYSISNGIAPIIGIEIDEEDITYQWYDNIANSNEGGQMISDSDFPYAVPNATLPGTTYYYVKATGACGTITSGVAEVIVENIPVADTIYGAIPVCASINSVELLLYNYTGTIQWQFSTDNINFNNILEATEPTYTVTNITPPVWYRAIVTVDANTAMSESVEMQLSSGPSLTKDLFETTYTTAVGSIPINLVVEATGYDLSYQWYFVENGSSQPVINGTGAQTSSFSPNISSEGTRNYYVTISDPCGNAINSHISEVIVTPILTPDGNGIIYVTESGSGNNSGNSWANATNNFQNALTASNVQQIWVASGTYFPDQGGGNAEGDRHATFSIRNDLAIYGGFNGTEIELSDRNIAANPTLLSGNINGAGNTYSVVTSQGTDNTSRIDGFIITGGNALGGTFDANRGGGIHVGNNSTAIIANCIIRGNEAHWGGGIYTKTNTNPTIINCLIIGNTATYGGGGICNSTNGSSTVINSTIANNTKQGVQNYANVSSTLINCIVWGNELGVSNNTIVSNSIVQKQSIFPGQENLNTDPLFVDASNGNYHLQKSTSAADRGKDEANQESIDLDGNPRKVGTIDLGPYENVALPPITPDVNGIVYVTMKGGSGDFSGSSWINATHDIQKAINGAEVQEVWVKGGIYKPGYRADNMSDVNTFDRNNAYVLKKDVKIFGGFAGTEMALSARDLSITTNASILSGYLAGIGNNIDNAFHVVISAGDAGTAELNGFTVTGGNANGFSTPIVSSEIIFQSDGGGIICSSSSPLLTNLIVSENNAALSGGGIYIGEGSPTLTNVILSENNANSSGGGIYTTLSSPIMTNITLSENYALYYGGGISNSSSSSLILRNATIKGNYTDEYGGGIYNESSNLSIINSSITGNNSIIGGGIYNDASSPLVLTNVTISGNKEDLFGGGIYNENNSLEIHNSIIYGNSKGYDGNFPDLVGPVSIITHSLVGGLTADDNGNIDGDIDPLFVIPLSPGLSTGGDYSLLENSPAINAGNNAAYPYLDADTRDLTGNPRLFGGTIDMGAYEHNDCSDDHILYVNTSATGENDGTSWIDAFTNLQDALNLNCTQISEVWVAKGTYFPDQGGGNTLGDRSATFNMKNNLAIYGGFVGTETTLSQRNLSENSTILNGDIGTPNSNADNTYNVVTSPGTDNTSRLDGFIITGGNTANGGNGRGGGIHHGDNSTAIVANCIIQGNTAQFGGGLYTRTSTNPTIINCLITGNTAIYGGGGICNSTNGSSTVINTTIAGNTKQGVQNYASKTSTLKNCIVWGNELGVTSNATVSYSIIQGTGIFAGTGNVHADPLFETPLNPGLNIGGDYGLQATSPAINAGSNQAYVDVEGDLQNNLDLADNARLYGDNIDMGAFEDQGTPPANDNCDNAIALECGQPVSGNTFNVTSSGLDTQCGPYGSSDARDVWYSFEADGILSYTVTVSTTTTDWDGVLFLFSGDCGNLVYETCADNAPSPYNGPETITEVLPAGTYYVRTFSYFEASSYTIELTCETADCPDLGFNIGDNCDDGDPNTINDKITADCECEGLLPQQCENTVMYPESKVTPSTVLNTINTCSYYGDYSEITGIETGQQYEFTITSNGYITVRTGTAGGSVVATGFSPLTIIAPNSDNLFVHWNADAICGTINECQTTTVQIIYDCPALEANIGESCDDGEAATENDVITEDCECAGTIIYDCPALEANIGDLCDDGDPSTENDKITADCGCAGTIIYDCPTLEANIGDACDDGDPGTNNDTVNENCNCAGTPAVGALNGSVTWNSNCGERNATVKLYVPGTATEVSSYNVSIQASGSFNIPEVEVGTFDVIVNVDRYLAKGVKDVEFTIGSNSLTVGALINGDLNNDGFVVLADFLMFNAAFGGTTYNPIADLNCDGFITVADFLIFNAGFNKQEDTAPLLLE